MQMLSGGMSLGARGRRRRIFRACRRVLAGMGLIGLFKRRGCSILFVTTQAGLERVVMRDRCIIAAQDYFFKVVATCDSSEARRSRPNWTAAFLAFSR